MKRMLGSLLGLLTGAVMPLGFAAENLNGESLYNEYCAMCHAAPTDERTPRREALATYTANSVYNSLTQGIMAPQGASLTNEQKIALAEYLTDSRMQADTIAGLARCQQEMPELDLTLSSNWNGWGNGDSNPRFQSAEGTGISATTIGELEFVWAFGLENASAARAQPSVINTVMFMGSTTGTVYAMDIQSGCAYWTYQAPQEVRAAVTIAWSEQRNEHLAVIAVASNDLHVVNAVTGELLWQSDVDPHPFARSTGSPVVSGDRIFVPVSSAEVSAAGRPDHHCCTFRGNVAAFDLNTGEKVWHTYIMEQATQVGVNSAGNPVMAPSGAPIWQAPSMDIERGVVYAGSGQNYTRPASNSSDAVIAFDMATGQINWIHQTVADDAFTMACAMGGNHPNCPDAGPDLDIGAPIIATTLSDGRDVVVAGTKGAVVVGLDPDNNGSLLWSTRVGRGGALGGVHWGMTFAGDIVYVPVSDRGGVNDSGETRQPGLHAIDMKTGEILWYAPVPKRCHEGVQGCMDAYSGPVTSTDGLIIASSLSGYLFAHDSSTGKLIWEYNTVQDYPTINGVAAKGGSIDATGPVLSGDYMIVSTGYATFGQMPGNAVLVFRLKQQ